MAFDIQGLLEDPQFNLGMGLLGSSGWSPTPVSFGQAAAQGTQFANARQQQIMQTQAMRDAMLQRKRQQDALSKLTQLNQPARPPLLNAGVAPINTPAGQQEALGLLAQAAPEEYARGLLGQAFPKPQNLPSNIETLQYLQQNPELMEPYQNLFGNNTADLDIQLAQLRAAELARSSREADIETKSRLNNQQANIQATLRNIIKMRKLAEDLRGTPLELGTPAAERLIRPGMAVRESFSEITGIGDPGEYRKAIADFDEFKKLASGLTTSTFSIMEGLPRASSAMELLQQGQPGIGMSTDANIRVLDTLLFDTVTNAEAFQNLHDDYKISNLEQARKALDNLGGGEQAPSEDQVRAYIESLSTEELEAIANGR